MERSAHPRCGMDRRRSLAGMLWAGATGWLALHPGRAEAAPASLPTDWPSLLRRIRDASLRRSYSGTYVVNAGGAISSSRIVHSADGRHVVERIESLDGQMRHIYRQDDAVHVFLPRTREVTVEQHDAFGGFPSLPGGPVAAPAQLGELYELQAAGEDRVAGHDAQVWTLRPRDSYRYAQRLWLERSSGLLLRTDTLGPRGETLESAAFSELTLDNAPSAAGLLQEMRRLEGYRVRKASHQRTDLEQEGWWLRSLPPGFVMLRCVRRPLRSAAPEDSVTTALGPATESSGVVQAVFGDGLTSVSLFMEPDAGTPRRETPLSWGATQALSRRIGNAWVTVVGDVPLVTLQFFSNQLERRQP
jgi:sigma-E factor negative regulatory protein RseB